MRALGSEVVRMSSWTPQCCPVVNSSRSDASMKGACSLFEDTGEFLVWTQFRGTSLTNGLRDCEDKKLDCSNMCRGRVRWQTEASSVPFCDVSNQKAPSF